VRVTLLPRLRGMGMRKAPGHRRRNEDHMKKTKRYAQGDIILELVDDCAPSGSLVERDPDGAVVLARGEVTGHRHAFYGSGVTMFRDDALARDMPAELYVGHIRVKADRAELRHEEHDTVTLPKGTYRVRRQREYDGLEAMRVVAD
jgi:hypothetical protein